MSPAKTRPNLDMEFTEKYYDNQSIQNVSALDGQYRQKEFTACEFKKCDFSGSSFVGTIFIDCAFKDCNLSNIKVDDCGFQNVAFDNCKLLGISFSKISDFLIDWRFDRCQIELCSFNDLGMKGSKFVSCLIKETDFVNADLAGSDFTDSNLAGSKFVSANLEKAVFVGAKNYYIDPTANKLKQAKFSYPEVLALLDKFSVTVD